MIDLTIDYIYALSSSFKNRLLFSDYFYFILICIFDLNTVSIILSIIIYNLINIAIIY